MNISCPICGHHTHFLTEKQDRFRESYEYAVCQNCRFLFEKDGVYQPDALQSKIAKVYGNGYFEHIDEGWQGRGDGFLRIFKKILGFYKIFTGKKTVTVLDYGAGNGYLASQLAGYAAVYYYDIYEKPTFTGNYAILHSLVRSDLAYAVELVEHFVTIAEWDFLKTVQPGIFIFTTGLSDNISEKELPSWPYLNPDFGHTMVYSTQSLYLLAKKYGYLYFFFPNISCHIFIKNRWLANINFAAAEYFLYSIFRKIKYIFKK